MSQQAEKYKGKSQKYKGVYSCVNRNGAFKWFYMLKINSTRFKGIYDSEYECAKQYDIKLIENGLQPVNVLKPK